MTTYFPFVPSVQAPFTFQPVLDGRGYQASVRFNLFGQRWYLNVNQLTGELVFSLPLLGSPTGNSIESIVWENGTVEITVTGLLGFQIGQTVQLTISGCVPIVLNGIRPALIVDDDRFTFALTGDPGTATRLGRAVYNINMAAGYFDASTLIYRADSQVFEVSP